MKMNFKVGISRHTDGKGWSHEYGVFRLEEDSMLADLPPEIREDETVVESFALREDQPEYNSVHDFGSLRDAMDDAEVAAYNGHDDCDNCDD